MQTNPIPKAKLESLIPEILKAWREDKVTRFMAGTLRTMIQQGLMPESIFPTMCQGIRMWIDAHLAIKYSASVCNTEANQLIVTLFIEVIMFVRSMDLGEAQ